MSGKELWDYLEQKARETYKVGDDWKATAVNIVERGRATVTIAKGDLMVWTTLEYPTDESTVYGNDCKGGCET